MLAVLTLLLALPSLVFVVKITINQPQLTQFTSAYRPLLEQGVILNDAIAKSRIEDFFEVQQLSEAAANWEQHVNNILIQAGTKTNATDQ